MDYSTLQKLPPELRFQVYEYVCYEEGGVDIVSGRDSKCAMPGYTLQSQGLLSTCRQIRNESMALFCRVNSFRYKTHLLGPNFQLVHGRGISSGNVEAVSKDLLSWVIAMGDPPCTVEVDLGVWFVWWQRASADIVAGIVGRLVGALDSTRPRLIFQFTVEWCAVPAIRPVFGVTLQLSDLGRGRRIVQKELAERDNWIASLFEQHCMRENMATCRQKLKDLFDLLSDGSVNFHCPVTGTVDAQKAQRVS